MSRIPNIFTLFQGGLSRVLASCLHPYVLLLIRTRSTLLLACQGPLVHSVLYVLCSFILWLSLSTGLTLLIVPTSILTASALMYFISWMIGEEVIRSKITFGNGLEKKETAKVNPVDLSGPTFSIPATSSHFANSSSTKDSHTIQGFDQAIEVT